MHEHGNEHLCEGTHGGVGLGEVLPAPASVCRRAKNKQHPVWKGLDSDRANSLIVLSVLRRLGLIFARFESSQTYPYPRGLVGPEIINFWGLNGPILLQMVRSLLRTSVA